MNRIRIGVYSVKGKISGKELGYMRFRLKDNSDDTVPMNVDYCDMYIRTTLSPGYTTYTHAFEDNLDYYMTYVMDDLELTIIEIYETYIL